MKNYSSLKFKGILWFLRTVLYVESNLYSFSVDKFTNTNIHIVCVCMGVCVCILLKKTISASVKKTHRHAYAYKHAHACLCVCVCVWFFSVVWLATGPRPLSKQVLRRVCCSAFSFILQYIQIVLCGISWRNTPSPPTFWRSKRGSSLPLDCFVSRGGISYLSLFLEETAKEK